MTLFHPVLGVFSVMSDIGLPDFGGQDLGIDLEKGIFVRKGKKSDNDSNDSGNNSMNTNGSGTYITIITNQSVVQLEAEFFSLVAL